jgi:hypothetical protein
MDPQITPEEADRVSESKLYFFPDNSLKIEKSALSGN